MLRNSSSPSTFLSTFALYPSRVTQPLLNYQSANAISVSARATLGSRPLRYLGHDIGTFARLDVGSDQIVLSWDLTSLID